MRRFAVVGSPIAHSLSPVLHTAAYRALGIADAEYERHEVLSGDLRDFLSEGPGAGLDGLSVTMPGKVEAHDLAAERDAIATELGIANTLVRRPDGSWRAENHDVHGIIAALRDHGAETCPRVGILGSGATALSAVAAARGLGARRVLLSARSRDRLEPVSQLAARCDLEVTVVPWERSEGVLEADATISALAIAGARAVAESWTAVPGLAVPGVLLDALYDPWPAPLAAIVAGAGGEVASGLEMLVHQADMQLRSMLGIPAAPLAQMRDAAREALAGD